MTRPSRAPFAVAMLGGSALVVLLLVRPAPLGGEVGSGGPTPRDPLPRSEPPASPARPATAEPPEPGDPTDRTDPANPARFASEVPKVPASIDLRLQFRLEPTRPCREVSLWVALPVDLPGRQTVRSLEVSHLIADVSTESGHHVARFHFGALAEPVDLRIAAEVAVQPYSLASHGTAPALGPAARRVYLRPEVAIESDDPEILAVARGLEGEGLARIEAAVAFVVEHVTYRGYVETRTGARGTYHRREGDCSDLTDLLVAVCRAAGVPARHAYGISLERGAVVRHSWAEIEHPDGGFIPVDPLAIERGEGRFGELPADRVQLVNTTRERLLRPYWFFRWACEEGELRVDFTPHLAPR